MEETGFWAHVVQCNVHMGLSIRCKKVRGRSGSESDDFDAVAEVRM